VSARRAVKGALVRAAVAAGYGRKEAQRALRDERNMHLLLSFSLEVDSNCIDIGSNEGMVLADMVRLAPEGRHIAYEPIPDFYARLVTKFPQVDIRNAALSSAEGTSEFLYVKNLPGYSGLKRRTYPRRPDIEVLKVRTERLDDHLDPAYVPALIKIDVEGAEALVIEGAMQTLRRHRPAVLFEFGQGAFDSYHTTPADMHRLIVDQAGLRLFDLDGNGPYTAGELERTYQRGDRWNWVAHR
jgi:FkbM family methyltransferase